MEDEIKLLSNVPWGMISLGIILVLLVASSFYLGSEYACKNTGGLSVGVWYKPRCIDIEVLGVCEMEGQLYTIPTLKDDFVLS